MVEQKIDGNNVWLRHKWKDNKTARKHQQFPYSKMLCSLKQCETDCSRSVQHRSPCNPNENHAVFFSRSYFLTAKIALEVRLGTYSKLHRNFQLNSFTFTSDSETKSCKDFVSILIRILKHFILLRSYRILNEILEANVQKLDKILGRIVNIFC